MNPLDYDDLLEETKCLRTRLAFAEKVVEAARKYCHASGLGDHYTFIEWFADRCVRVYGESENVDFVIAARAKGGALREAIRAYDSEKEKNGT